MIIGFIERLIELILNFRIAEKNLKIAMNQHNAGPQVTMIQAFMKGEYQHALAISSAAQRGVNVGVFDGSLLMQIGRLNEAERMIAEALASETEPKSTALAQCVLGDVYLFQHQFDKALACYNSALSLWPERGGTYRAIAEVGLRRGEDPSVVLQWARLAVEKEKTSQGIVAMTKVANLGAELATLAWAVAASSHNSSEVESLVAEADSFGAGIPVSSIAQVHVYSAMAYAALGNEAKRAQHLEAAARVDPNGVWGREAQQQTVTV